MFNQTTLAEWEALRRRNNFCSSAQETCLHCSGLLESIVLPAAGSQAAAVALFLVSKSWRDAVQSLEIWNAMEWSTVCKGARRSDAALPALLLAVERWWGGRLLEFDAGSGCPITRHLLTDTALDLIVRHSPRLRSIRLFGCRYVTDAGLKALAAAAPPLEAFYLEWAGKGVYLGGLRAVIRACPRLQTFAISSGQQAAGLRSVTDELVAELAACCPRIRHLELSDTAVGDEGLEAIAEAFGPRLSTLTLNYSRRWGGRGVRALAAACSGLQSFTATASGLDDDSLAALAGGCTQLACVGVDRCTHVSLDGVMRLANRCPAVGFVAIAGIHRQSTAEQQAAFARWVEARGLRYDSLAGVLRAE